MAYTDLRDFIAALEREGELVRVKHPVSAELEITEIADRTVKSGGPALLFENVAGSSMPVLINHYGSMRRMAMASGWIRWMRSAHRSSRLCAPRLPAASLRKLMMLPRLAKLASAFPKTVKSAPCQEVVRVGDEASLDFLACSEVLARRWRAVYHAAHGLHERPRDRHAKRGHVSHARL